ERAALEQVSGARLANRARWLADERSADRRRRGVRAHAEPGAARLLHATRLLLCAERLDRVGPRVRGPAIGAVGGRLLPRARATGRGRVRRVAVCAWHARGRVRLRLEL